ncbi:hypothetical protein [Brevundimonas vesicularis]|uniref:hypothetical protein n=1 Tax=Brevundimonas vesicularis TaxID=41276 RepID=UPI0011BEE1BD
MLERKAQYNTAISGKTLSSMENLILNPQIKSNSFLSKKFVPHREIKTQFHVKRVKSPQTTLLTLELSNQAVKVEELKKYYRVASPCPTLNTMFHTLCTGRCFRFHPNFSDSSDIDKNTRKISIHSFS